MGYVHLHNHTEYSKLDGLTRIDRVPQKAKELGQNAVASTDHGDMRGAFMFQKAALKAGIKAIHGCEFYLAFGSRFEKNFEVVPNDDDTVSDDDGGKEKRKYFMHLTVLARTKQGFKNLVKVHNGTYDIRADGASANWNKPRMDFDLLKQFGEGLIVLTGCLGGPVAGPLARAAKLDETIEELAHTHEVINMFTGLDRELTQEEAAKLSKAQNLAGQSASEDLWRSQSAELRAQARANLNTIIDAVGRDNVYIEVMYHRIGAERRALVELIALSEETGIPLVATNDCHYENEDDHTHHDGFLAVGVKKSLDDPDRFKFNGTETYFMRSEEQMLNVLGNHPEEYIATAWRTAVANSQVIADRCEEQTLVIPKSDEYHLPKFPLPDGFTTAEEYLGHLVDDGAKWRYGETYSQLRPDVVDRLKEELRVINLMGFPDYFLIVQDLVRWARSDYTPEDWVASDGGVLPMPETRERKKPILVGPGRGSAAGAAVSFVTGIVNICPLRYHLLFERFLEEGRAGMPDIDLDFERDRRQEVFRFIVVRWGKENVAHIGSTNYALTKAAIKDAARILKPSNDFKAGAEIQALGNKLANLVPERYTFEQLDNANDQAGDKFRELVADEGERADLILDRARAFEGIAKAASIHPCGFIISPIPLDELVPMRVDSNDDESARIITWSDKACESMGLLKMDILGIQNLDIISKAFDGIARNQGVELSMDTIPDPDDSSNEKVRNAYQLLSRGDTTGVFQSESGGMRGVFRDVQPEDLNDLSAVIALFRPGPLTAGVPDLYAARKHGRQKVDYTQFTRDKTEQEWLDSVLSTTFGLFVFQEQLMRLGTVIAGFDAAQRSTLRRAVGKKDANEMAKVGEMLVAGAEEEFLDEEGNVISPSFTVETAKRFFELAKGSASYLFNASHSAAYAQLAYVTAFLKANWPVEYGAAILATSDKSDKRISALQDLRSAGITVDAPSINHSVDDTSAVGDKVVIGLKEIKNVGSVGSHIFAEREANGPYASMADVMNRVQIPGDNKSGTQKISVSAMQALVEAGAFDEFGPRLGQLVILRAVRDSDRVEPVDAEWTVLERSARQRALIGIAVGLHPIIHHAEYLSQWRAPVYDPDGNRAGNSLTPLRAAVTEASETSDPYSPTTGGIVAGWEEKAFSGGRRAIMQLESPSATVETMIWDRTLSALMRTNRVPQIGDLIAVSGRMKIKTTTLGETSDDEMAETITVPSLSLTEMFPIPDPDTTTWNLPNPGFDVASIFEELQGIDVAARRKAERAAAKAAGGGTATITKPARAAKITPALPEVDALFNDAPATIDWDDSAPAAMDIEEAIDFDDEPAGNLTGSASSPSVISRQRHVGWRHRRAQGLPVILAGDKNTLGTPSTAAVGAPFLAGTVRYMVTRTGEKIIVDEIKAKSATRLKSEEYAPVHALMAKLEALETLPEGEPCNDPGFDGWRIFNINDLDLGAA